MGHDARGVVGDVGEKGGVPLLVVGVEQMIAGAQRPRYFHLSQLLRQLQKIRSYYAKRRVVSVSIAFTLKCTFCNIVWIVCMGVILFCFEAYNLNWKWLILRRQTLRAKFTALSRRS